MTDLHAEFVHAHANARAWSAYAAKLLCQLDREARADEYEPLTWDLAPRRPEPAPDDRRRAMPRNRSLDGHAL